MKIENKSFAPESYEAPALLDIPAVTTPVLHGDSNPSGGGEPDEDDVG